MQKSPLFVRSLGYLALISLNFADARVARSEDGPKYGPNAQAFSLGQQKAYFEKGAGPDFFRLLPFYSHQDTGSACSLAALTTLLNAVQSMNLKRSVNASTKNFTPQEMRKNLLSADYVARMSGKALQALKVKQSLGISISEFRDVVEKTLVKADLTAEKPDVKLVEFKKVEGPHRAQEKAQFLSDLKKNESSGGDFIILNFLQGILTGDPEGMIGHVAMVAAYHEKTDSVLILDPDGQYYEPYWAPAQKVFEAITDARADRKSPGYLVVTVK
jgi:hypothetical protein